MLDDLEEQSLIHSYSTEAVALTAAGILDAEEHGLISEERLNQNKQERAKILDVVAKSREENGTQGYIPWKHVLEKAQIEETVLRRQYVILLACDLVKIIGTDAFAITIAGYGKVLEWRKRVGRSDEFEALKVNTTTTRQQRGHDLERLLEQLLTEEGWECERNVRAPGEENDLVIHREREYYLVECKWEQERTGTSAIRNLQGKLTDRAGVNGLFVSMGGYASDAIDATATRLSSRIILLFGPFDVERLMRSESTFTNMLNTKFNAAISKRHIDVQ